MSAHHRYFVLLVAPVLTLACSGGANSSNTGAASGGTRVGIGGSTSAGTPPSSNGGAATLGGAATSTGNTAIGSVRATGGQVGTGTVEAIAGGAASGGSRAASTGGHAFGGSATGGLTATSGGTATTMAAGGTALGGATSGSAIGGTASITTPKTTGGFASGGSASGGKGTIGSVTGGTASGGNSSNDTAPQLPKFIIGADISSVDEAIDSGTRYADTDGKTKPILDILKNHGFNFIRLRAFVKPGAQYGYAYGTGGSCIKSETYCDTAHTAAFAKQVKAAGMGLLLDLHYSDTWADPGNQIIPEDWRGATTITQLAGYVQSYTEDVIGQLASAGAKPDIVQIGNEITPGMLINVPNSSTDCWGNNVSTASLNGSTSNWGNLGTLLKAGIAGVKAVDSSIKTMVHIENTKSSSSVVSWVKSARAQGVAMDIVGLSCYEAYQGQPSVWKTAFDALASNFSDLSFVIAEYNPRRTEANQVMYEMPAGRGLGTFFWEPTQSGDWGSSLFTWSGNTGTASASDFAEFDSIAHAVGLK